MADATHTETPVLRGNHPLDTLEWVDPNRLVANNYNPNKVFRPELNLLALSIIETGWTQPIVVRRLDDDFENGLLEVVDGFHRSKLAKENERIRELSGGLCPVVFVELTPDHQKIATIRHNRARGTHGVLKMGDIVRQLKEDGLSDGEIMIRLGMEQEEIDRITNVKQSPDMVGKDSFGKGWVPDVGN